MDYSHASLTLYSKDTRFNTQQPTAFENIVGKGEIAHEEQFLLFPQCFLLKQIIVSLFVHIFAIISLPATELEEPKIGISGKGLTLSQTTKFRLFQIQSILYLMKMVESSPKGWKTLWEKEKLLDTSNFSFSHSVFKRLVLQSRKNQSLFGKGLSLLKRINPFQVLTHDNTCCCFFF